MYIAEFMVEKTHTFFLHTKGMDITVPQKMNAI